MATKPLLLRLY